MPPTCGMTGGGARKCAMQGRSAVAAMTLTAAAPDPTAVDAAAASAHGSTCRWRFGT